MTDIRVVFDGANTLGEGPLWDVAEQRLYWIDSMNGLIFRATADGREMEQWKLPLTSCATISSCGQKKQGWMLSHCSVC